jgi:molybdopterin-guanine dinucleotide biosynthesis protein A
MGTDKALVEFRGQPLIAHAVRILRDAGLPVSIAGCRPESLSQLEEYAPAVNDLDAGRGPLSGICTAAEVTPATWLVFISVDQPLLPAELVVALLAHAQITGAPVTLSSIAGFAQTFPAVVNRAVLPALRAELAAGRRGCYSAFRAAAAALGNLQNVLPAELLAQSRQVRHPDGLPPARWFFNINSPEDLRRANAFRAGFVAPFKRIA